MKKLDSVSSEQNDSVANGDKPKKTVGMPETNLTEDETQILNTMRARQMIRSEDLMNIDHLAADVLDGRRINLKRGSLGLVKPTGPEIKKEHIDVIGKILGEDNMGKTEKTPVAIIPARTEVSTY